LKAVSVTYYDHPQIKSKYFNWLYKGLANVVEFDDNIFEECLKPDFSSDH